MPPSSDIQNLLEETLELLKEERSPRQGIRPLASVVRELLCKRLVVQVVVELQGLLPVHEENPNLWSEQVKEGGQGTDGPCCLASDRGKQNDVSVDLDGSKDRTDQDQELGYVVPLNLVKAGLYDWF